MKTLIKKLQLSEKQSLFHQSTAPFRLYCGGRGSGKSYGLAIDLILRASHHKGSYLVVAPTQNLLREGMVPALYGITEHLGILRYAKGNPLCLRLVNDSRIVCRVGSRPDLLRGGSYSGCVLDEAALLSPTVKDILMATLRERGKRGWMSFGTTPKGRYNYIFSELATGRPNTFMVRAHTRENPFVDPEFTEALIANYDEFFRRQEVEGEFLDDDEESQVIPSAWVEDAMIRGRAIEDPGPISAMGVDTARGGSSRFTCAHRCGSHITRLNIRPGSAALNSNMGFSIVEQNLGGDKSVLVNIDISGGTGSGVFDLLDDRGYKCVAMNFGAAPPKGTTDATGKYKFANFRSWMYWRLREALNPAGPTKMTLPDSYELAAELTCPHWFMNGSGAIQLQPKEQIAKVLRRSPDLADAVALTMLN